jgi:hypothetical protein
VRSTRFKLGGMRLTIPKLSGQQVLLIVFAVLLVVLLLKPEKIRAQPKAAPVVAEVGVGSPLPVYVVNELPPVLPEGFVPGTSWKFSTWTLPSSLTFTAVVQKTEGGWAYLTVNADPTSTRWYYIPQMPGAWEPQ